MSDNRPALNRKSTRRERRAAVRAERPPVQVASKRPGWRSPMAMLTGGALLVGVVVIVIALVSTGQIGADPAQVKTPVAAIPDKSLWDGRALGPADAKVTVEAFEDFQCPACAIFTQQTQPALLRDFIADGRVRFVFKDMAFLDNGDPAGESHKAAIAARCAGKQDLFWPYHEYLYANQKGENKGHFSDAFLLAIATKVGADPEQFTACTKDPAVLDEVIAETQEGMGKGVNSTPTLIVNGEKLSGGVPAYVDLKAKIEALLGSGS